MQASSACPCRQFYSKGPQQEFGKHKFIYQLDKWLWELCKYYKSMIKHTYLHCLHCKLFLYSKSNIMCHSVFCFSSISDCWLHEDKWMDSKFQKAGRRHWQGHQKQISWDTSKTDCPTNRTNDKDNDTRYYLYCYIFVLMLCS